MAHIPEALLNRQPVLKGLELICRGKVRDSYRLPGHPDKMLVVASDRVSIFDLVLNATIPLKGWILTAMNEFWTKQVSSICKTDLVACGRAVDEYLPDELRNRLDLQSRASVVRRFSSPPVEDIVRIHLTGSGWQSYRKDQTVCGHKLPAGLKDGDRLPFPIYTPTTKADMGHDEHLNVDQVVEAHGFWRERLAIQLAMLASAFARSRGIILADTKFEMIDQVLIDERLTPDSSRFWDLREWQKAMAKGKTPPPFDKQHVRNWGLEHEINMRDPKDPEHRAFVHGLVVPEDIISQTTRLYRFIFWRLTGERIENYLRYNLGVEVGLAKRRVHILVGSKSDLPQIERGFHSLASRADVVVSGVSCHRNPLELMKFCQQEVRCDDIVIVGAGKAAALPGMCKAFLCQFGLPMVPVIGVAFKGESADDNQAAILSIENLPGQPVELDQDGHAYFGPEGFVDACGAAVAYEFLPRQIEAKPADFNISVEELETKHFLR